MKEPFLVGVTRDALGANGVPWPPGLEALDADEAVRWEVISEDCTELSTKHLENYDGILLLGPELRSSALVGAVRTSVVARFGVGYDQVDVEACTRAGVLVTNTPQAVRRPVASAMLGMVLTLAHRIRERDLLVRTGRWADRFNVVGVGLTGRTLGLIGLGSIGAEFARLAAPFEMRMLAFDPFAEPARSAALHVELVELDDLLSHADFVCIAAPLTPETHHLIDADALGRMKPSAYLVNAARGPIVDELALIDALKRGIIAGAGLDVFDTEPLGPESPLVGMNNVVLTPHSIAHTDELYQGCGASAVTSLIDVAHARLPGSIVNRDALEHMRLRDKFERSQRQDGL